MACIIYFIISYSHVHLQNWTFLSKNKIRVQMINAIYVLFKWWKWWRSKYHFLCVLCLLRFLCFLCFLCLLRLLLSESESVSLSSVSLSRLLCFFRFFLALRFRSKLLSSLSLSLLLDDDLCLLEEQIVTFISIQNSLPYIQKLVINNTGQVYVGTQGCGYFGTVSPI